MTKLVNTSNNFSLAIVRAVLLLYCWTGENTTKTVKCSSTASTSMFLSVRMGETYRFFSLSSESSSASHLSLLTYSSTNFLLLSRATGRLNFLPFRAQFTRIGPIPRHVAYYYYYYFSLFKEPNTPPEEDNVDKNVGILYTFYRPCPSTCSYLCIYL